MDQELLSMKNFEEYVPVDSEETTIKEKSAFVKSQHMVGIPIILLNIGFLSTTDETAVLHVKDKKDSFKL